MGEPTLSSHSAARQQPKPIAESPRFCYDPPIPCTYQCIWKLAWLVVFFVLLLQNPWHCHLNAIWNLKMLKSVFPGHGHLALKKTHFFISLEGKTNCSQPCLSPLIPYVFLYNGVSLPPLFICGLLILVFLICCSGKMYLLYISTISNSQI